MFHSTNIMRVLCLIFFVLTNCHGKIFEHCRFVQRFYRIHPNIFELNQNQTTLTVRPLYSLSNQSFTSMNQSLDLGIIYRFAETYLVPIPLVFQCAQSEQIFAAKDCEFTLIDTRSDSSIRMTESTRTSTVPLHFQSHSSHMLYGAYFKQSNIALRNCRLISKENLFMSNTFHLRIEFEQTIGSKCDEQCLHSQLYQCSTSLKTCQCRSHTLEKFGHLCIDSELASNCSLSPERCRRLCQISKQLHQPDPFCQCPLGTRRIRSNSIYRCELPKFIECDTNHSCPNDYFCRNHQCLPLSKPIPLNNSILPLPILLISLLIGALLIIIMLIIGLLKMRSVKCVKFVHPKNVLGHPSNNSSPATITRLSTVTSSASPCSTLSSSSKSMKFPSTNKTLEKYTKMDLFDR